MCREPRVTFGCGCQGPRHPAELPLDDESLGLRQYPGNIIVEPCDRAMYDDQPCDPVLMDRHPDYSTEITAMCINCLAKTLQPPLSIEDKKLLDREAKRSLSRAKSRRGRRRAERAERAEQQAEQQTKHDELERSKRRKVANAVRKLLGRPPGRLRKSNSTEALVFKD